MTSIYETALLGFSSIMKRISLKKLFFNDKVHKDLNKLN